MSEDCRQVVGSLVVGLQPPPCARTRAKNGQNATRRRAGRGRPAARTPSPSQTPSNVPGTGRRHNDRPDAEPRSLMQVRPKRGGVLRSAAASQQPKRRGGPWFLDPMFAPSHGDGRQGEGSGRKPPRRGNPRVWGRVWPSPESHAPLPPPGLTGAGIDREAAVPRQFGASGGLGSPQTNCSPSPTAL